MSRKRMAGLMQELGIEGATCRRFRTATTKKGRRGPPCAEPVEP